jgi:hypothetical protein
MKRFYTIAIISVLGGLLVHLTVLLVIQIEIPSRARPDYGRTSVRFVGDLGNASSASVADQAALNDSAPLFIPTRWNSASNMSEVASLQSATRIFEPFPSQITLFESRPVAPMSRAATNNPQSALLPEGSAFFMARYGRKVAPAAKSVSPGPAASLTRIGPIDGEDPIRRQLPADLVTSSPASLWNPVRLFLHLEDGLPVGLPLLSQSSGYADWDSSLRAYFVQSDFYRRMNDGYYQIWVYP